MWRPAGAVYLGFCAAGLAAGVYPEALCPPHSGPTLMPPPALSALAAAQATFLLLVYPLALWRRWEGCSLGGYWSAAAIESAGLLFAALPLYLVAGYFSDATVLDGVRTAMTVGLLLPAAWAAGLWLARGAGRAVVLFVLLASVLGGPAMAYVGRELLPGLLGGAASSVSPVLLAWRAAGPGQARLWTDPAWEGLLWPALGAVAGLVHLLAPQRRPARETAA